ncbi:MAG TPA: hypothetical protein PK419_10135, partial [Spirochaetota bacterium]|nr:hypothetical protein [Spirochaetota bacterium]
KYSSPNENKINNDLPTNITKDPISISYKTDKMRKSYGLTIKEKGQDVPLVVTDYYEAKTPVSKHEYEATNLISKQGCFLTMLADMLTYETGRKYTPQNMNIMGDAKKAYQGVNTVPGKMLDGTGYALISEDLSEEFDVNDMQNKIEARLSDSKPTGIQVGTGKTHFLSITGARYDAAGNVIKYLTSDPGTPNANNDYIDKSTMQYTPDVKNRRSNPRKVERILYMVKTKVGD